MTPNPTSVKVDRQFAIGRQATVADDAEALPALKEMWAQLVQAFNNSGRKAAHIEVRVYARKEDQ